jgi:hypothetical protein
LTFGVLGKLDGCIELSIAVSILSHILPGIFKLATITNPKSVVLHVNRARLILNFKSNGTALVNLHMYQVSVSVKVVVGKYYVLKNLGIDL